MSRLGITSWQRRQLRRQLTPATDARLYRRALAVLEYDRGRDPAAIARLLGVSRQSVYNWAQAFARSGRLADLADRPRSGRPSRLRASDEALLGAALADSPRALGYPDAVWALPLLQ